MQTQETPCSSPHRWYVLFSELTLLHTHAPFPIPGPTRIQDSSPQEVCLQPTWVPVQPLNRVHIRAHSTNIHNNSSTSRTSFDKTKVGARRGCCKERTGEEIKIGSTNNTDTIFLAATHLNSSPCFDKKSVPCLPLLLCVCREQRVGVERVISSNMSLTHTSRAVWIESPSPDPRAVLKRCEEFSRGGSLNQLLLKYLNLWAT